MKIVLYCSILKIAPTFYTIAYCSFQKITDRIFGISYSHRLQRAKFRGCVRVLPFFPSTWISSESSLLQTICGLGWPLASHVKVKLSPSRTTGSEFTSVEIILGGTENILQNVNPFWIGFNLHRLSILSLSDESWNNAGSSLKTRILRLALSGLMSKYFILSFLNFCKGNALWSQ